MRKLALPTILMTAVLVAGCTEETPGPTDGLSANVPVVFSQADPKNAHTHLTGDEEVPAVDTNAQGQLTLRLSADGETLSYRLIASNIENVLMAHLHMAPAGSNGGVVVWLYPSGPPPVLIEGRHDGVLAEGEITAASLVGALAGADLSLLIDMIEAGTIYANVHTTQYRGGEIRGQVETGG